MSFVCSRDTDRSSSSYKRMKGDDKKNNGEIKLKKKNEEQKLRIL
jgi:hypothetical protein